MKYLHFFVAFTLFIIESLFSYVFCVFPAFVLKTFGAEKKSVELYQKFTYFLTNSILIFLNVKVHVKGMENLPQDLKNVAFVSNHQSFLDIVAYYAVLKIIPIPIAKVEVMKLPIISNFVHGLNSILIDRKSPRSSIKAIHLAVERLKNGGSCIIFPEGTRSKNGVIGELKAGSFKMALHAKSTLVPLVVNGGRLAFEDKKGWHRYTMYIQILPPFETKTLDREQQKTVAGTISQQMKQSYAALPALQEKR